MSRTADQIRADAERLAKARDAFAEADREMPGRLQTMVRRLRSAGVMGPEIADIFGVTYQLVYKWLDGATGPDQPSERAASVRAEARELAKERTRLRRLEQTQTAKARALAAEVDASDEIGPSEFCRILGVSRQAFYKWLDRSYTTNKGAA